MPDVRSAQSHLGRSTRGPAGRFGATTLQFNSNRPCAGSNKGSGALSNFQAPVFFETLRSTTHVNHHVKSTSIRPLKKSGISYKVE